MLLKNKFFAKKYNSAINYWQTNLKNIAPILNFPTDKVRAINSAAENTIVQSQKNLKQKEVAFSAELSIALKNFSQQTNVPLGAILLSAFQVLLYRYTSQKDIVVGCLNLYGYQKTKLEILPIRVSLKDEQNFAELLALTQTQISAASNYLDLNLVALAKALKKESSEFSLASISQILFRFNPSSQTSQVGATKTKANSELFLDIIDKSDYLICQVVYDRHLYNDETIQRICNNYQILLKSIIDNPQVPISALSLLSTAERQQVLVGWNSTQVDQETKCIHQLFAAKAASNPTAVAVICQGEQLTYGELNQKANQLAYYLQSLGIGSESLVGIYLERSIMMVVGILGILKAGAAYVPLDSGNPQSRQAFILEDAKITTLLTQASLLDQIPSQIKTSICLDRDWDVIVQHPQNNCPCQATLSNLALIIYTSGSTGKPKGVMTAHGNLSHYASSLQIALNIKESDVYLHRGQIALIASARQLLMPLTQGAAVVILTELEKRDPLLMFDLIKRYGVTIVDRVPSFWLSFADIFRQLDTQTKQSIQDNSVRLVATGGEQVTLEVYDCWRETFAAHVKFATLYGQTEGTGVVTVYDVPTQLDNSLKSLPVGSPIPNMQVYLLDDYLQPVPIGVAAEIHISGAGVALGYLNRPELTKEKFIDNPYMPGERLYKTGDLGRYLSDGSIQFLGRLDRQVNIQGLRIELGEIEAVLSQHESIQEAAVVVRSNKLGETLAVYLVPTKTASLTAELLKSYLQQKLPAYMVPKDFIFVAAFPLTTSGKVDRLALSALNTDELSKPIVAPRDRLELEMVQMLEEILGIKKIGIRDNFIELGGNSLLAARLVAEIENRYQQKIPLSTIFQAFNIENLANLIRQKEEFSAPKCLVPIKQGNSQPNLFAIHNLGYGLEFYLPLAKYLHPNLSIDGLSSFLSNESDKPHPRDIRRLAAYYTHNLKKVQPQGPYYLLGVSFGGLIVYEIAQLLVSQGHEVRFLGMVDTYCPNQNAVRKQLAVQERILAHLDKIHSLGVSHILNLVKWRIGNTLDTIRAWLYQIDWVRENFVDQTSRNFDKANYARLKKEHQEVNQGYAIQPYPGKISMFRAAHNMDSKLDWQDLAQLGLSIYDVPGEHLEILQVPHVQVLAEKIQSALQKCEKIN